MLSRPATKITLTMDDIIAYEHRKAARDAAQNAELQNQEQMTSSQGSNTSTVEDAASEVDVTPAQQTRAAKAKAAREARMGVR
ncbi:hypothetical protein LTR62_007743 [Meristemomyces frigidus]|uniref:Anaphase-promoting complex subunit CDC26 n=1 Tax=Meristemomyces frigidus TaxID=1508187 RepID=A0AAN7YD90_9PEZI|nr:hypothetical protein LTR62_007743 [Meristemomyces frigidus]